MSNEIELIQRAQAGDHEAFCELARAYQRRIYSLALHYTRNPVDAEDLSQEVWLKAYRSLSSYRGEASIYTWLRQITINTLLNQQRLRFWPLGKKNNKMLSLDEIELSDQGENSLLQHLLVNRVWEALSNLKPRERLIFLLKHREGMTYEEIAEACKVSVGTIKKGLFRAVNKVRDQLGVDLTQDNLLPLSQPLCEFTESRSVKC